MRVHEKPFSYSRVSVVVSPWSNYGKYTVTYRGGQQHRTRDCNNLHPRHGGEDYHGSKREFRFCGNNPCLDKYVFLLTITQQIYINLSL